MQWESKIAKPTLSDGSTTLTLSIDRPLSERDRNSIIEIDIPERAGGILQDMGRRSKRISINGYTKSQSEKNSLKNWNRNRTSLIYNDDENTDLGVRIIGGFESVKLPGMGTYYRYSFMLIEDE